VWPEDNAKRPLLVSLYHAHPQLDPPLPDCDYKNLIVQGAKHWQLPADYIQELESIPTTSKAKLPGYPPIDRNDHEDFNGRRVLVRFIISDIKPEFCKFEQSFSTDNGKTWEVNWIAIDTRVKE
jgi:hypothetical protein